MSDTSLMTAPEMVERPWNKIIAHYREPRQWQSVLELAVTVVPLVGLWVLAWASLVSGFWPGLVLVIPAAGFLVRLFMIQHDCGHGSFFASRAADDWVGRAIGVLTLTPYDYWRQMHALHHASAGNLDKRGFGDVDTRTLAEYWALSRFGRLRYRLYRHPVVLFGIGPTWLFILQQRLPFGLMRAGARPWISTMGTNLAIAALVAVVIVVAGWQALLFVHLPIVLLAGAAGVWLFYVQHQFEETHWAPQSEWEFKHAALHGSSFYDLPAPLRWMTANIGIHHVHHLVSRVPFYRLTEVLRDHPELGEIGRITLRESLAGVRLALWDEEQRRLISFREARAAMSAPVTS